MWQRATRNLVAVTCLACAARKARVPRRCRSLAARGSAAPRAARAPLFAGQIACACFHVWGDPWAASVPAVLAIDSEHSCRHSKHLPVGGKPAVACLRLWRATWSKESAAFQLSRSRRENRENRSVMRRSPPIFKPCNWCSRRRLPCHRLAYMCTSPCGHVGGQLCSRAEAAQLMSSLPVH